MESKTFAIYSDESGVFEHRFQTIALISSQQIVLSELRSKLKGFLDKHEIDEIKFSEIRTHRPKLDAARDFIRHSVKEFASQLKIRIDVLIWDTQDSRHTIRGRDDIANLEFMYYKVLTHAVRQWNQIEWDFYPDKNSQVHWNEIADYLNRTRLVRYQSNLLSLLENEYEIQPLRFKIIDPLDSLYEPLIQLADLFAGMARFVKEEGKQCIQWLDYCRNKNQLSLPSFINREDTIDETIITKQNRFQLIGEFNNLCKHYRMGVSLRQKRCLWTPDPTKPINFWNYEPQHEYDKAPKRKANKNEL